MEIHNVARLFEVLLGFFSGIPRRILPCISSGIPPENFQQIVLEVLPGGFLLDPQVFLRKLLQRFIETFLHGFFQIFFFRLPLTNPSKDSFRSSFRNHFGIYFLTFLQEYLKNTSSWSWNYCTVFFSFPGYFFLQFLYEYFTRSSREIVSWSFIL